MGFWDLLDLQNFYVLFTLILSISLMLKQKSFRIISFGCISIQLFLLAIYFLEVANTIRIAIISATFILIFQLLALSPILEGE